MVTLFHHLLEAECGLYIECPDVREISIGNFSVIFSVLLEMEGIKHFDDR